MNQDSKLLYAMFAVVLAVAFGAYFYPGVKTIQPFGATPTGGYNVTPFAQSVVANLANPGANGTSTSLLNTSSNDYYITSIDVGCENLGNSFTAYTGAGLASLTLKVSTSSTAAPAAVGTNLVGGAAFTIPTSTASFVLSSSTVTGTAGAGTSNQFVIWSAGSYLTFQTNATNTAACTFTSKIISA